eukprot:jgi/Bigna1/125960/aug1.1_g668
MVLPISYQKICGKKIRFFTVFKLAFSESQDMLATGVSFARDDEDDKEENARGSCGVVEGDCVLYVENAAKDDEEVKDDVCSDDDSSVDDSDNDDAKDGSGDGDDGNDRLLNIGMAGELADRAAFNVGSAYVFC